MLEAGRFQKRGETGRVMTAEPALADQGGRETYLRLTAITKKFGDFTALRDISLEVFANEFVLFLGPSGCGKTTLLRIIAGLDVQTAGLIEQSGREISSLPPAERDYGIVFQSYALFPNLTVFKNVAYGLESERVKKGDVARRVEELLDLVGIETERNKYPAQLSGGQQQRVAVARAIATSPGLLLLDEPLSALDARVRVHLRHELKRLQQRLGITTIMVTHDQGEALTMADRIVVMNHGVIEQIGTPKDIYEHPATPFVADFIGAMNLLPARVVAENRVKLGDLELTCDIDGIGNGEAVTVAIRAEDILVGDSEGKERNSFVAQIDELNYVGSFYRVILSADAIGEVRLTADFPINAVRDLQLSVGASLQVALLDKFVRVFVRT
jgi:iron(III) transport system ATP-binding protein